MSQLGVGGISAFPGGGQGEIVQWPGIYYGAVSNNADPQKKNRCLLRIPQILGGATTTWASPLTPLVDPPAVGTLVCALFVGGDLDYPVYLVVNPAVPIESNTANVQPVGTTGSAGTSHKVAAADHVHTLANALESTGSNIQPVGTQAAGTSAKAARADHAHAGLPGGSAGILVIDSTTTGVADVQAEIDLFSKNVAGHTEIDLNATQVLVNGTDLFVGNGSTSNINLNPQMVPPSTWPLSSDPNTGSSWATGERQYINDLVTAVNGIINSLRTHKLMQ